MKVEINFVSDRNQRVSYSNRARTKVPLKLLSYERSYSLQPVAGGYRHTIVLDVPDKPDFPIRNISYRGLINSMILNSLKMRSMEDVGVKFD